MSDIDSFLDGESAAAGSQIDAFLGPDKPARSSLTRRVLGDAAISAVKSAIAVPETAVGIADIFTGGRTGKALEGIGFRPNEAKQMLDGYLSQEQQDANHDVSKADGFVDKLGAIAENPSVIPHAVVESAAPMLAGGVVGRGIAALAPKVAPMIAGAAGEGAVMAGSQAEGIRQQTEDGLLTGKQSLAALGTGVVGGALGAAGARTGKALGIGDVDTALVNGAVSQSTRSMPARVAGGAMAEGALEEMPQSAAEQALQNYALDRDIGDGVGGAAAMGLATGGAMGAGFGVLHGGAAQGVAADAASGLIQPAPTATDPSPSPIARPDPANGPLSAAASMLPAPAPILDTSLLDRQLGSIDQGRVQQRMARPAGPESPNGPAEASIREAMAAVEARARLTGWNPLLAQERARLGGELVQLQQQRNLRAIPDQREDGFVVDGEGRVQDGKINPLPTAEAETGGPGMYRQTPRGEQAPLVGDYIMGSRPQERMSRKGVTIDAEPLPPTAQRALSTRFKTEAAASRAVQALPAPWRFTVEPQGEAFAVRLLPAPSIAGNKIDSEWSAFAPESGTLSVPRAEMPQIKAEHRGAMVNFLNARGIQHEEQTVPAASLKPTQAEFSRDKVAKAKSFTGGDRSILISSDGHVLDGHHQWLAKREAGDDVRVIQLKAPIRDLLPAVAEFPSATQDAGAQTVTIGRKPKPKGQRRSVNRDRDSVVHAVIRLGGITNQWKQDTTGDTVGNKNIPGVGALWSDNTGTSLDDMASLLDQHGYVPAGEMDRDGGVSWLQSAIRNELAGQPSYAPDSARQIEQVEEELLNRYAEEVARAIDQREAEYARIEAEYGPDAADDARSFDQAAIERDAQLDREIADAEAQQDTYLDGEPVDDAAAARRDDELRQADGRADRAEREEADAFALQQQTEAELAEQARQQQEREQAEAKAKAEADEKARKAAERAAAKQQNDAANAEFQLGQDAEQNLSGQRGMFDESPDEQPAAEQQAATPSPAATQPTAPANWRKNFIQARQYAKALGVPVEKGQKLAQVVAAIDAKLGGEAVAPSSANAEAPGTRINTDADREAAGRLEWISQEVRNNRLTQPEISAVRAIDSVAEELRRPKTVVSVQAVLSQAASRMSKNPYLIGHANAVREISEQLGGKAAAPKPSEKIKPSKNVLVSDERAAELRARLKAKLNGSQLNSGIDPEILAIGTELAVYHVERGVRKFAAFAQNMAADLGVTIESIRPYLRSWYNGARDMTEDMGGDVEGMDSPDVVREELAKLGSAPVAANPEPAKESAPTSAEPAKWFGTQAKADGYLIKQGMTDTHEVVKSGASRFEIRPTVQAPPSKGMTLLDSFYAGIKNGSLPSDNRQLRSLVSEFDGNEADNARLKEAQEDLEAAIARHAADIASKNMSDGATFRALLDLYASQPNLNIRTSSSIESQAYSTPAPLAYLAARLADIDRSTAVYEPTAGNGMLLLTADPKKATANELQDHRYANLVARGFNTIQGDALDVMTSGAVTPKSQAAIITNPPFGSIKDDNGNTVKVSVDGYKIGQIDHLIAAESLKAMKDDGKAVLIIGANKAAGGINTDDRIFFNWLYANYNVTSHFEVDGALYARQGASWPVRVISINGRAKSDRVSPATGTVQRVRTWEDVYEQYQQALGAQERRFKPVDGAGSQQQPANDGGTAPAVAGGQGSAAVQGSRPAGVTGGNGNVGGAPTGTVQPQPAGQPAGTTRPTPAQRDTAGGAQSDRLEVGAGRPVAQPATGDAAARTDTGKPAGSPVTDNAFQGEYIPRSSRKDEGVLVPVNMSAPLQDALSALEDEVGNIDQFAMRELGYPSVEALHDALMGLQVDSVASAIYQIKSHGKGIVIADQTGIGKGRQAASIIRWAARSGYTPVFVTVKPSLYTDMYGDLADIGTNDIEPFIMNGDAAISSEAGDKLFANKPSSHRRNLQSIAATGKLPDERNAVFVTYSQVNTENVQRQALRTLAPNAIFILDESHNASGESKTGEYMREVLDAAKGVVYLSATYAKRPDNMPLYFKTDIGAAISDSDSLIDAMAAGGLPLQTVIANNLVKAGQMFRRERSYDGVSIDTVVDTASRERHEALSDAVTESLRAIVDADRAFHNTTVRQMKDEAEESGEAIQDNAGNQASASVDHTQFTSVVHNFVRQMLLGLKADAAANEAIAALKRGEKPLIALENTMGSFLTEYASNNDLKAGDPLGDFDYRTVLSRALARTLFVSRVLPNGEKVREEVPLSALGEEAREKYRQAQELIDDLDLDIPVSPLDWIRHRIEQAGYSVAEITGRSMVVDYSGAVPKLSALSASEQKDKVNTTRRFNSGELDAVILNVAGSTGISLHASSKFKDQRKRVMVVAQAAQDINIFMQMLGRVHRTGQIQVPGYKILNVDLPAEKRPTALLNGKMKSLNANTSSNTESATSIKSADMLNKYGDQVIGGYLMDNVELMRDLDVEKMIDSEGKAIPGLARTATGRMALMPVQMQKDFYAEIEEQYSTLIEYLNASNQNELEPRTFDFEAELIKDDVLVEATDPRTPFGQEAIYGEWRIKAQGKQMSADEIRAAIDASLDGKTADSHSTAMTSQALREYWEGHNRSVREGKAEGSAVNVDEQVSRGVSATDNAAASAGFYFIRNHKIGSMWRVEINGDVYNGTIINLRSSHKKNGNPFSLSKIQVTVAVNGPLRTITVPGSQWKSIEVAPIYGVSLDNAFRDQVEGGDKAKIVTGNLLAAYGELKDSTGTIISFTKKDGTTEQGILLPKKFDFKANTRGDYQFRSPEDTLKYLSESRDANLSRFGIASRSGEVRVRPSYNGAIKVTVPKSKARGGKFFLDKRLTAITGDFVTDNDGMSAIVRADKALAAIKYLQGKAPLYALPSMADDARSVLGASKSSEKANYRLNDTTTRGIPLMSARMIAGNLADSTGLRVSVAADESGLPSEVRAQIERDGVQGRVAGVYHNGTSWLIAANLRDTQHAASVVLHEAIGHGGVKAVLGERIGRTMRDIYRDIPQAQRAELESRYAGQLEGLSTAAQQELVAEEYVAHLAETDPRHSIVGRLIALLRQFIRSALGDSSAMKWTRNDLVQLLAEARIAARNGEMNGQAGRTGATNGRAAYRAVAAGQQSDAGAAVESGGEFDGLEFVEGLSQAELAGMRPFAGDMYRSQQTDSPFFRRWFGKSLMKDKAGTPVEFWHRSFGQIDAFDDGRLGSNTGTATAALGHFFAMSDVGNVERYGPDSEPFFLRLEKPKLVSMREFEAMGEWSDEFARTYKARLQAQGHDGLFVKGLKWAIVFEGRNVKAARNAGTFDESGNVRYSLADDARAAFERAIGPAPLDATDPFAVENRRLREEDRTLWDKAKKVFARQFAPGGLLPKSVFAEKITRDSEFQAVEFDVRHLVGGLNKAVKAAIGKDMDSLTAAELLPLKEALAGKVDPSIPEPVRVELVAMRQYIDRLSTDYLAVIQGKIDELQEKAGATESAAQAAKDARQALKDALDSSTDPALASARATVKDALRLRKQAKKAMVGLKGDEKKAARQLYDEAVQTHERAKAAVWQAMTPAQRKLAKDAGEAKAAVSEARGNAAQAQAEAALYEKIKANIGAYVHRSYQAFDDPKWFKSVPVETLNSARQYLIDGYLEQGESDTEARRMTEVTLAEILKTGTAYDTMEAMISEGKLGAKDLSVMIKRKEIAPQIRALMGEYSDPRLNFAKSATKMGRLVWNQRFLDKVREVGMGSFLFTENERPADATVQMAGEQSDVYAPLNGLWTFPEVAQAFKDALGKEQMSDLYRTVVRLNGMVKYGKTVLSPTTAMRNWQSAMFFSLANGHFDLSQMKKSMSALREQVLQSATGADLTYMRKLKQLGVVYDTPYAGEMAALMADARMDELLSSKSGTGLRWLRKANQFAQGFYSVGDDWFKVIGFENEKAGLIKAGMDEAAAEKEAAHRVRSTYPTYSMIGRGIQWLRRFPLAGTFVSFPAEIVRTSANMLRITAADLKSDNPAMVAMGRKRAIGMAMVSAAFYALSAMTAAALGVDDDEEEALRDLSPPWSKNSTFLFLGRDDDGKLRYVDMSFLDPYGYWKRPITAMLRDQPWEDAATSGLSDMLSPFFGADITAGAIFEVLANKKPTGGTVYNENAPAADQLGDITNHMRKALQPGFVSNAERLYLAGKEARREGSGQPYDMRDEVVSLLGWRASTLDTKTGLYYRAFDFTDGLSNARKTLTRTLRSSNEVSEGDIRESRQAAQAQQQKAFVEMARLVRSAEAAGMSRREIAQTLKLSGVSQQNVWALIQGRVPRMDLGVQVQAKAIQQARVMRDSEHAAEIARRFRIARQIEE